MPRCCAVAVLCTAALLAAVIVSADAQAQGQQYDRCRRVWNYNLLDIPNPLYNLTSAEFGRYNYDPAEITSDGVMITNAYLDVIARRTDCLSQSCFLAMGTRIDGVSDVPTSEFIISEAARQSEMYRVERFYEGHLDMFRVSRNTAPSVVSYHNTQAVRSQNAWQVVTRVAKYNYLPNATLTFAQVPSTYNVPVRTSGTTAFPPTFRVTVTAPRAGAVMLFLNTNCTAPNGLLAPHDTFCSHAHRMRADCSWSDLFFEFYNVDTEAPLPNNRTSSDSTANMEWGSFYHATLPWFAWTCKLYRVVPVAAGTHTFGVRGRTNGTATMTNTIIKALYVPDAFPVVQNPAANISDLCETSNSVMPGMRRTVRYPGRGLLIGAMSGTMRYTAVTSCLGGGTCVAAYDNRILELAVRIDNVEMMISRKRFYSAIEQASSFALSEEIGNGTLAGSPNRFVDYALWSSRQWCVRYPMVEWLFVLTDQRSASDFHLIQWQSGTPPGASNSPCVTCNVPNMMACTPQTQGVRTNWLQVPILHDVRNVWGRFYGILNCDVAGVVPRADMRINGVTIGSYEGLTGIGRTVCSSCNESAVVSRGGTAGFSVRNNVQIGHFITYGTCMCVQQMHTHFCYEDSDCPPGQERLSPTANCTRCEVGTYKSSRIGECLSCPAGTYGSTTGLTTSSCTTSCPQGYYCLARTVSANQYPCPAGTFGSVRGLTNSACSGLCSPGFFCPQASVSPNNPAFRCAAGRYGLAGQTNAECTGPCAAGHFCPVGSSDPRQTVCGGPHVYCPTGTPAPVPASPGFFTVGETPETAVDQLICPPGFFCVDGVSAPCPAGRFGNISGISSPNCTGPCAPGFTCPVGSTSGQQLPCGRGTTPATFYCPEGSSDPLRIPLPHDANNVTYYTLPEDAPTTQRVSMAPCPDGFFCRDGIRRPSLSFINCEFGRTLRFINETFDDAPLDDLVGAVSQTKPPVMFINQSAPLPPSAWRINSTTGEVRAISAVNYEDYVAQPALWIQVGARIDNFSVMCNVSVEVLDVNEQPRIERNQSRSVLEQSPRNYMVGAPLNASDPDIGQDLNFEIESGNEGAAFRITSCGGQLMVLTPFFYRQRRQFNLTISVTDSGVPALSDTAWVVVDVIDRPDPPAFNFTGPFTIHENSPVGALLGAVTAFDDDDNPVLRFSARPAAAGQQLLFALEPVSGNVTVAVARLNFEVEPQLSFMAVVMDETNLTATAVVVVDLLDANDPPVITPPAQQLRVAENSPVNTLVGARLVATDEDDGDNATFFLSQGDADGIFNVTAQGQLFVQLANIDFERVNSYALVVGARDWFGSIGLINLTVLVTDLNEPPVWVPWNWTVQEGLVLASAPSNLKADDEDADDRVIYRIDRSALDGALGLFAVSELSGAVTTTAALDFETKSEYNLTVVAEDSRNPRFSVRQNVTITVEDVNEPPVIHGPESISLPENNATCHNCLINATDPDAGDVMSFSIAASYIPNGLELQAMGASPFGIDNVTGLLTVDRVDLLDFETFPIIVVEVLAKDLLEASHTFRITVNLIDVNEPPVCVRSTEFRTLPSDAALEELPTDAGLPVSCSDPERQPLTYALLNGGSDFSILPTGVVQQVRTLPENAVANMTVTVTDIGQLAASVSFNVAIQRVNAAPRVPAGQTFVVTENVPLGTFISSALFATDRNLNDQLVITLIGSVPFSTTMVAGSRNATLRTSRPIDFEALPQYDITAVATDNEEAQGSNVIRISVIDVNEHPMFNVAESLVRSLPENSARFTPAGLVIGAWDQDANDSLTYSMEFVSGQVDGFTINSTSGQVSVRDGLVQDLDFESPSGPDFVYTVTVRDRAGLNVSGTLHVSLTNVNEAPSAPDEQVWVPENAAPNTLLGRVRGVDPDSSAVSLTYTIVGGNTDGAFRINNLGDVTLIGALDFEDLGWHALRVNVRDPEGLSTNSTFTVWVTDVNDLAITRFSGAVAHQTSGGETLVIEGANLGPTGRNSSAPPASAVAWFQAVSSTGFVPAGPCTVDAGGRAVRCLTVAGIGTSIEWRVDVTWVSGTSSVRSGQLRTTYVAPLITSVGAAASALPTAGGQTVVVQGSNLGPLGTRALVLYRSSWPSASADLSISCNVTTAHAEATCVTVAGSGGGLSWLVEVGGQRSPSFAFGSHAAPAITSVESPQPLDTRGGEAVVLNGTNLGASSAALSLRLGQDFAASACRVLVAHTSISCVTGEGAGASLRWVVSVSGLQSQPSAQESNFSMPRLESVTAPGGVPLVDMTTEGGQDVVLTGQQLGPAGRVAVVGVPVARYGSPSVPGGEFVAVDCVVTQPHVRVQCKAAPGTGRGHAWSIVIAGQESQLLMAGSSYARPVVAQYFGRGARNATTSGREQVIISGRNFGTAARARVDDVTYSRGGQANFTARQCNVTVDHVEVTCWTDEGAGSELSWKVMVDGQESRSPTTDYGVPSVLGVLNAAGASTDGGQRVDLVGGNFGPPSSPQFLESVTYGETGSEYAAANCTVAAHDRVSCALVPGVGRNLRWLVRVLGQTSQLSATAFSYADPSIASVSLVSLPTLGGAPMVVRGSNFGVLDTSARAELRLNGQPVVTPQVATRDLASGQHLITLSSPEGFGANLALTVAIVRRGVTVSESGPFTVSFLPPTVELVRVERSLESDALFVLIVGRNFGPAPGQVIENGTQTALAISSWSHTFINVTTTLLEGEVRVVAPGGQSAAPVSFSFRRPRFLPNRLAVGNVFNGTLPTQGGASLSLEVATNNPELLSVTVGGRNCSIVNTTRLADVDGQQQWRVDCLSPEGEGRQVPVNLRQGLELLDQQDVWFAPPTVSTTLTNLETAVRTVTLSGANLGLNPIVVLRPSGSRQIVVLPVQQRSHTNVTVTLPVTQGTGHTVEVIVADQTASLPLSFLPPVVSSLSVQEVGASPFALRTRGAQTLVITGSNFGTVPNAENEWAGPVVFIGPRQAAATLVSSSEIRVQTPAWQGAGLPLRVLIDNQEFASPGTVVSYAPPQLLVLIAPLEGVRTAGGDIVQLQGSNFGMPRQDAVAASLPPPTVRVELEGDTEGDAFDAQPLTSVEVNQTDHEQLTFLVPVGQGANRRVALYVAGQRSTGSVVLNYAAPRVDVMTPVSGSTDGGFVVRLEGDNFGLSPPVVEWRRRTGSSGPLQCTNASQVVAHRVITCRAPSSVGRNLTVTVGVGRAVSEPVQFSYDPPVIDFVIPNLPDAQGQDIVVRGRNFGSTASEEVQVIVGGLNCMSASWALDFSSNFRPYLRCTMMRDVVGYKNITVVVAEQTATWSAEDRVLATECKKDFWGLENELCLPCPEGATCGASGQGVGLMLGEANEPIAKAGFYDVQLQTGDADCPEQDAPFRSGRQTCVNVVACQPKEACVGANVCQEGYRDVRCTRCSVGFYRLDGECERCPSNPLLTMLGLLAAAVALCVVGFVLTKAQVNLGFLSIGIDYLQALAIFASAKINWPPLLLQFLRYFTLLNFNIEMTAPECTLGEISFKTKWMFQQLVPLAAVLVMLLLHCALWFNKRVIKCRKNNLNSHVYALVGTLLVLMYYLYLFMARTTLTIFNCSPVDPDDGYTYMEAVFERCYQPGGLHEDLLPYAYISVAVYLLALPGLIGWLMYRFGMQIREDQYLRAKGSGGSRMQNPRAYTVRKALHKLYYQFKPDYWYWVLAIMLRKFALAFTGLIFRRSPGFMLAVALLVIFVGYVVQSRIRPYMSGEETTLVLRDLERNAADDDPRKFARHKLLYELLSSSEGGLGAMRARRAAVASAAQRARAFLWNLNTVEGVLLICAALVLLGGVMFQSDRFRNPRFFGERDALQIIVLIILASSLVYFAVVFSAEVLEVLAPRLFSQRAQRRAKKDKTRGIKEAMRSIEMGVTSKRPGGTPDDGSADLAINPLFVSKGDGSVEGGVSATATVSDPSADIPTQEAISTWSLAKCRMELMRLSEMSGKQRVENQRLVEELRAVKKSQAMAQARAFSGPIPPPTLMAGTASAASMAGVTPSPPARGLLRESSSMQAATFMAGSNPLAADPRSRKKQFGPVKSDEAPAADP